MWCGEEGGVRLGGLAGVGGVWRLHVGDDLSCVLDILFCVLSGFNMMFWRPLAATEDLSVYAPVLEREDWLTFIWGPRATKRRLGDTPP